MADTKQTTNSLKNRNRFLKSVLGLGSVFALIFSVLSFQAVTTQTSQAKMGRHHSEFSDSSSKEYMQEAHWRGERKGDRRGWKGGFFGRSSDDAEERISRMIGHMAVEIDATPEQTEQITAIVTPAAVNMQSMRESYEEAHEEFQELLTADTIDKDALEKLRSDKIAEMDKLSKEWLDVIVQVSEILTPEQREELEDMFGSRKGWKHGRY